MKCAMCGDDTERAYQRGESNGYQAGYLAAIRAAELPPSPPPVIHLSPEASTNALNVVLTNEVERLKAEVQRLQEKP